MSYDIKLVDPETRESVGAPHHSEGGTYAIDGVSVAELNITYNYGECYRLCNFSLRDLYSKKAKDTISELERVISCLGVKQYTRDYWAPTPGNAGYACSILLAWARQHPEAVWEGDKYHVIPMDTTAGRLVRPAGAHKRQHNSACCRRLWQDHISW